MTIKYIFLNLKGVFIGMTASAIFWGQLSDKFGRKKVKLCNSINWIKLLTLILFHQALGLSAVLVLFFGFLSSFAPTFYWILLLRTLVGFAIGCSPQSYDRYSFYCIVF